MKVTPIKKKFGKYQVGDVFDMPDKTARIFIKAKKLEQVTDAPPAALTYQTRMMQADPVVPPRPVKAVDPAPYGYKADGTPRLRPAPAPRKASE